MSNQEIEKICEDYKINNDTIRSGGIVDVAGDVYLNDNNMSELPLRFGSIRDDFFCCRSKLTSLVGSPHTVGRSFYCNGNKLTSLEGGPSSVGGGEFNCADNQLTDLKGCPKEVGGRFICNDNEIINLDYLPDNIEGTFYCKNTPTQFYI